MRRPIPVLAFALDGADGSEDVVLRLAHAAAILIRLAVKRPAARVVSLDRLAADAVPDEPLRVARELGVAPLARGRHVFGELKRRQALWSRQEMHSARLVWGTGVYKGKPLEILHPPHRCECEAECGYAGRERRRIAMFVKEKDVE